MAAKGTAEVNDSGFMQQQSILKTYQS